MSKGSNRALQSVLATDCGSTTTKAILIELVDGVWRQTYRGEAPTTVEAPFEDVTRGVLNAAMEIQELSGRTLVEADRIVTPADGKRGVDIYISTSSAGGGLARCRRCRGVHERRICSTGCPRRGPGWTPFIKR